MDEVLRSSANFVFFLFVASLGSSSIYFDDKSKEATNEHASRVCHSQ